MEGIPIKVVKPGSIVVDAGDDAATVWLLDAFFAEAVAVEERRNTKGKMLAGFDER